MHRRQFLALTTGFAACPKSAKSRPGEKDPELEADLEKIREEFDMPSIAASGIIDGKVVGAATTGVLRRGGKERPNADSKYHIGSCTKSMTATLAATFVEEGKLSWDTPLGDVLSIRRLHKDYGKATLLQLLSNSGGFPKSAPPALWLIAMAGRGAKRPSPTKKRLDFISEIAKAEPAYEPGKGFTYSNAGFTAASAMMEEVSGNSWEESMQERIFAPLGMASAGFGPPEKGHPWGHSSTGAPVEPGPSADNPVEIAPSGAVHCTITDWSKYAHWHLHAKEGAVLKKPKSFEFLQRCHIKDEKYGLGWIVHETVGDLKGPLLQHNGSNTMWYSLIWILPEMNFAAVAVANSGEKNAHRACDSAIAMFLKKA